MTEKQIKATLTIYKDGKPNGYTWESTDPVEVLRVFSRRFLEKANKAGHIRIQVMNYQDKTIVDQTWPIEHSGGHLYRYHYVFEGLKAFC